MLIFIPYSNELKPVAVWEVEKKNAFINLKTYGAQVKGLIGQRLKSQGGLTSKTYGELSLGFYSLHYNLCEKVGQKLAITAQCARLVVSSFHVKPEVSQDKSFVMAILYSLNPSHK